MTLTGKHWSGLVAGFLLCLNLGAESLNAPALMADYVILGEVHDNAEGHALRLSLFQELIKTSPALAMEQFNLENNAPLQQQWQQLKDLPQAGEQAKALAQAGGFDFKGWHWDYYQPVLALVLEQQIPLAAANLSRREAGLVMQGKRRGAPASVPWSAAQQQKMLDRIRTGHCNQVEGDLLTQLGEAQRARDYEMAQAMIKLHQQSGKRVVLMAGNGHADNFLGVPFWLHALDPAAKTYSVGILEEQHVDESDHFDQVFTVKEAQREDPCARLNLPKDPGQLVPHPKM
jgi:uncharacterized iron-regulated protein